jgi:hypothetical protein
MRWRGRVDLDEGAQRIGDVLSRWWVMMQWPDAQPYSGGVLDAWPARIADGLVICRNEWAAVRAAVEDEAQPRKEPPVG